MTPQKQTTATFETDPEAFGPGTIGWCSRETIQGLMVSTNVISIGFDYQVTPAFPVTHKRVLRVSLPVLERGDILDQGVAKAIYDFVIACGQENIVVHCGEGRIRSPAVVNAIAAEFDRVPTPRRMFGGGSLSDTNMDRELFCQLSEYFETMIAMDADGIGVASAETHAAIETALDAGQIIDNR
jgi:hypothetical protein